MLNEFIKKTFLNKPWSNTCQLNFNRAELTIKTTILVKRVIVFEDDRLAVDVGVACGGRDWILDPT